MHRFITLHACPAGQVPWSPAVPVHLQSPAASSHVSPVLQMTPVQGGTGTQTPLELQTWPARQEFGLAVHLQTFPEAQVGVVPVQAGLQGWGKQSSASPDPAS